MHRGNDRAEPPAPVGMRSRVQTGYIVNRCSGTSLTCITLLVRVRERSRDLVGWAGDRHAKSAAQIKHQAGINGHPPSIFSVWSLSCLWFWEEVTITFSSEKCILYSEMSGVRLVRQRRCCLSFGALRRSRKPIFFQLKNNSKQPSLNVGRKATYSPPKA